MDQRSEMGHNKNRRRDMKKHNKCTGERVTSNEEVRKQEKPKVTLPNSWTSYVPQVLATVESEHFCPPWAEPI